MRLRDVQRIIDLVAVQQLLRLLINQAPDEADYRGTCERDAVATGRDADYPTYDRVAQIEDVVLLQKAGLLDYVIFVEDIVVLVQRDHRQAACRRSNDRVHDDVVRAVVFVQVDDFLSGTAVHEQARDENNECPRHQDGNVLRVKGPLDIILIESEDGEDLLAAQVFELRILLPEPIDVPLLHGAFVSHVATVDQTDQAYTLRGSRVSSVRLLRVAAVAQLGDAASPGAVERRRVGRVLATVQGPLPRMLTAHLIRLLPAIPALQATLPRLPSHHRAYLEAVAIILLCPLQQFFIICAVLVLEVRIHVELIIPALL